MPARNRTVSSKDVAALAGVSQSTVSYVMSGKRAISEKTRDKVERAMRQLGYVPDAHARAMISNQSHIIGLVTETTESTQGAELFPILDSIRATSHAHGYDIILIAHGDDVDDMKRLAAGNLVDAFIMLDIHRHDRRLEAMRHIGTPVVPYGDPGAPYDHRCVDSDQGAKTELTFQELTDIGARTVVLVEDARGGEQGFPFIEAYERNASESARRRGIRMERFNTSDERWESFLPLSHRFAQWTGQGVCLYARSPRVLAWIEQMMLLTGYRPGTDIGLIGECTDQFAAAQPVPISNISPRPEIIATRAVELAIAQIEGDEIEPGLELIQPSFTRRGTTVPGFAR